MRSKYLLGGSIMEKYFLSAKRFVCFGFAAALAAAVSFGAASCAKKAGGGFTAD
jgi:hypothetical protein